MVLIVVIRPIKRAIQVYHAEGLRRLVAKIPRYVTRKIRHTWDQLIRPHLPRKIVYYNGVRVRAARWFDSSLPWYTTDRPKYEAGLINGIRECVKSGDSVVIVGGGWGVSSVVAATQTGEAGSVVVYEGSASYAKQIHGTSEIDGVTRRVSVHHAVVGPEIELKGDRGDAPVISPRDLPGCDVLVLDCEGAEADILSNFESNPRTIIVETHGLYDSPEKDVKVLLEDAGYEIIDRNVAEVETITSLVGGRKDKSNLKEFCIKNDVFVLVAKSKSHMADDS